MTSLRVAQAASACALLFGALHVAWPIAYFYAPAFGRFTLGPDFAWAFGRPRFVAFDLVVAALFVLASALPLADHRPWGARVARWALVSGLWTAAALLGLRGVGGVVTDLLVLLGAVDGALTRWVVYDLWFLLCGALFAALAWQSRRKPTAAGQHQAVSPRAPAR